MESSPTLSMTAPEHGSTSAKILMLHGTLLLSVTKNVANLSSPGQSQSGGFFEHKTRFLQDPLRHLLQDLSHVKGSSPVHDVQFYYPTGLLPANPDSFQAGGNDDYWAWAYGDYKSGTPIKLKESINYIGHLLEHHGPFVGIIGFSLGAAIAAMVSSLLEGINTLEGVDLKVSPSIVFRTQFYYMSFKPN